jgi:hypothetical protein
MLILATTTDTIEVVLGGAPVSQLPIYANYRDITTSTYTPGRNAINTNGTTAVVAVGAPGASTQRVIDFFSIYNPNAADATVTVRFDLNGTEYVLTTVTLAQHERLQYQEGDGWIVLTATGAAKRATDFFVDEPLPVELYGLLNELVKAIDSLRVVDQQQRQRITLDAITGSLVLGTVSTVTNIGTLANISAGTLTNLVSTAGMDREQYINIAAQTYATAIRPQLQFV